MPLLERKYLRGYLCEYLRGYLHEYLCEYLHGYPREYSRRYLHEYLHGYPREYSRRYLREYLTIRNTYVLSQVFIAYLSRVLVMNIYERKRTCVDWHNKTASIYKNLSR